MSTELMDAPVQAIAAMPADMAIMRLENETIQSLAAARPRNHATIKANIIEQLEAYPSFAKAAIYSKPVGKDDRGQMKFARGLSVRAAEALAEAYGYCRVSTNVIPIDDDTVKVEATFTDYQQGRIWQDAGIVSKWYKGGAKQGYKMIKHADDRFYGVVVKAELSRRVREVITRSVPPGMRAELFEMAERKMAELLDDKSVAKTIAAFGKMGVKQEQLEEYLGRTIGQGWTQEDRLDLQGVWNSIEQGETSAREVFGGGEPKAPAKPAAPQSAGSVSPDDLTGATKEQEPAKKAAAAKKPQAEKAATKAEQPAASNQQAPSVPTELEAACDYAYESGDLSAFEKLDERWFGPDANWTEDPKQFKAARDLFEHYRDKLTNSPSVKATRKEQGSLV